MEKSVSTGSPSSGPDANLSQIPNTSPSVVETGNREVVNNSKEAREAENEPPNGPDLTIRPDGGLEAWLQVCSSWAVIFCTFGLVNSFGVYQAYYEQVLLTTSSSSDISWIGSIQGFLLLSGGIVSGPLFDKGYFRHMVCIGLFFIVFGMFMTSLCTTYWQVFLAQGLCVGLGCGIVFLPATAILSQYFSKRVALATGLGSSGSPTAGALLPIIFNQLEPKIGFGWATRVIAFILLGLAVIPLLFFKTRLPHAKHSRALIDTSALTDPTFLCYVFGGFFAFMGLYIAFFYIELFTEDFGLASDDFAPYMLTFMNAASILGRVIPGIIADHTGAPCIVMGMCALISSILNFGWLGIRNFPGAVVFTILYGAFSGGIVSCHPAGIFALTADHSRVGSRLGMGCFIAGLAVLVGSPVGGAILGDGMENSRWDGLIGFGAVTLLLGSLLILTTGLVLFLRLRAKTHDYQ
ncbi:major facilitator superfamily domain-containing protein [Xylariales sp. PMI_506]|nr:major facilitator superfamily domain-containing protein [Xylariales sp. PMI_506]